MGTDIACSQPLSLLASDFVSHDTVKSKRIKLEVAILLTGQSSQFLTFFSKSSFPSFL